MAPQNPKTPHNEHHLPLWALFLTLLALTAGEVILYDMWVTYQFIPKYALVIVILLFTLPKAAIVMIYFMHLKFERQLVVFLAVVPFPLALGIVITILSDTMTLKPRAFNKVQEIGVYAPAHHEHTDTDAENNPTQDHHPHDHD